MTKIKFTILVYLILGIFNIKASSINNKTYIKFERDTIKQDILFRPNYPDGIYITKGDFINKTPNSNRKVEFEYLFKSKNKTNDSIPHNCYFFYNDKKVKNVFAISYQGHLFFQIKAILKNRNKYDRAQSTNY